MRIKYIFFLSGGLKKWDYSYIILKEMKVYYYMLQYADIDAIKIDSPNN